MENNLFDTLKEVLKKDERFISNEWDLLKNIIREKAINLDVNLIWLLLDDDFLKNKFFIKIKDSLVFDSKNFIELLNNKEFLENSFTRFKNKVWLSDKQNDFLASSNEIVLSWPYKDCILAWWQDKEDTKRDEIFYNEILWSDDIDRLLDEKVFTNFKRIGKDWEIELKEFKRDKEVNKKRGLSEDTITDNLLIKWNNLLALHSLKSNFAWKVKLIYIDPPYNTWNDSFKYNDRFNHSTWLTFMKNRLEVAKELLKDDWVIFVQCDDNEQAYLKVIMDEVFNDNFLNSIIVKSKASSWASWWWEDKKLKKNIEYIHIYSKWENFENFNTKYIKEPLAKYINWLKDEWKWFSYNQILINEWKKEYYKSTVDWRWDEIKIFKHTNYIIKSVSSIIKEEWITEEQVYNKYIDTIFTTENAQTSIRDRLLKSTDTENTFYTIEYIPVSGKNKWKITNVWFIWNTKRLVSYLKNTCDIEWKKVYKSTKLWALWSDLSWSSIHLEWWVKLDNGKKPEKLIERIINLATNKWDIVLDYHLWSGTTGAVAHKMWRQYIWIEQMDYIETISKERLKKVIDWEQGWISKSVEWKGGWDFVYMEIMEENERIIREIESAWNDKEIIKIYDEIKNSEFINFYVDIEKIDENLKDENNSEKSLEKSDDISFEKLSLENKKRFLIELLDKNLLYKNYSEIKDWNSWVEESDKKINEEFYWK